MAAPAVYASWLIEFPLRAGTLTTRIEGLLRRREVAGWRPCARESGAREGWREEGNDDEVRCPPRDWLVVYDNQPPCRRLDVWVAPTRADWADAEAWIIRQIQTHLQPAACRTSTALHVWCRAVREPGVWAVIEWSAAYRAFQASAPTAQRHGTTSSSRSSAQRDVGSERSCAWRQYPGQVMVTPPPILRSKMKHSWVIVQAHLNTSPTCTGLWGRGAGIRASEILLPEIIPRLPGGWVLYRTRRRHGIRDGDRL